MFSPKHSRGSSAGSIGLSPLSLPSSLEGTVASLEDAVTDSRAKCAALITDAGSSESSIQHLETIKQLSQKLESMQSLMTRLRSQI